MLRTARDKASSMAATEQPGIENPDISTYNPEWINQSLWLLLVSHWNKPKWQNLSTVNTVNTEKRTGGSHTTGSGGFLAARRKLEAELKRPPKAHETFIYNHVKKGTDPFDLKSPQDFVNDKSRAFADKVTKLLKEKHGSNEDDYPHFDQDIWDECTGGIKKGRFYGSSNSTDPCYVLTGTPSSLSTCSSYATQGPQVKVLTQSLEDMQAKHELQQKEIDDMKKREEAQRKELEDLKAKNKVGTEEMKATIATMMKYIPNMTPLS
uniref:uncharacterized protein LOC122608383 n=1 Tax=Erigeron canadensis TaxID=72917 RepID=UPI001CB8911D|nr:uncharacterized protein LOC122608383 [Erigeron canadensis]